MVAIKQTRLNCEHLRSLTNRVIADLSRRCEAEALTEELVAWGKVWCHEVRGWINDDGEEGYTVFIEGASQKATKFRERLVAKLRLETDLNVVDVIITGC